MLPTLSFGWFELHTYGLMWGLAVAAAGMYSFHRLVQGGSVPDEVVNGLGLALLAGLAGMLLLQSLALLLQTALLRLEFTEEALQVWRQQTLLRRFPYAGWQRWRLFWPALPVLFYFREERSIHLLPMLFNAAALQEQLQLRLPALGPATTDGSASPAESGHSQG